MEEALPFTHAHLSMALFSITNYPGNCTNPEVHIYHILAHFEQIISEHIIRFFLHYVHEVNA
jgi:hypothetical protein